MDTSIKCSDEVKSDYNSWTGIRDITYNQQLGDALRVFESNIPFRDLDDFKQFFCDNPEHLGFVGVVDSSPEGDADFIVEGSEGDEVSVKLALMSRDLIRNDSSFDVDYFVTCFSEVESIDGVEVLSSNMFSHVWGEFDRRYAVRSEISLLSSPVSSGLKNDLNTEVAKASGRIKSNYDRRVVVSGLLSYALDQLGEGSEEVLAKIEEADDFWRDIE